MPKLPTLIQLDIWLRHWDCKLDCSYTCFRILEMLAACLQMPTFTLKTPTWRYGGQRAWGRRWRRTQRIMGWTGWGLGGPSGVTQPPPHKATHHCTTVSLWRHSALSTSTPWSASFPHRVSAIDLSIWILCTNKVKDHMIKTLIDSINDMIE